MILSLLTCAFSLAAAPVALQDGFLDSKMPPGLTIQADQLGIVGAPQRRLVREIAYALGSIGYSTRDARYRLPRRGDVPKAIAWVTTDGARFSRVQVTVDLSGEQPEITTADTIPHRQFSPTDSTQMDLAIKYLQSERKTDAHRTLLPLVKIGYPEALYLLGGLIFNDSAAPNRCQTATKYYTRAIDSGLAAGHAGMARIFLDSVCGKGRKSANSFRHLLEASDRGISSSMVEFGAELLAGRYFPKNIPMGVFVLSGAASNREPQARVWIEDLRERLGDEALKHAISEGRLRYEGHHFGLRPLPVSTSCRLNNSGDSVVPCAVRSGILVNLVFDGSKTQLTDDQSQTLLLDIARGNIDQATAFLRAHLGCLQLEALDIYDLLRAQVPALPTKSKGQDSEVLSM